MVKQTLSSFGSNLILNVWVNSQSSLRHSIFYTGWWGGGGCGGGNSDDEASSDVTGDDANDDD